MEELNPYLPQTQADREKILSAIGVKSIEELFGTQTAGLGFPDGVGLPGPLGELALTQKLESLAVQNKKPTLNFLGSGRYPHFIPAAVRAVMSMGGFFTAYTPYQAEASQGMLAAIFEFQTMIVRLTGLEVSNASLYDGATAAVEACVMAVNQSKGRSKILLSSTISPSIIDVIRMSFHNTSVDLDFVDCSVPEKTLENLKKKLDAECAGFLAQTPDFLGFVPDFSGFSEILKANSTAFILSADPLSLALFKTPAEWGADIAVGDVQAFGLDMSFGGPSAGYMAVTNAYLRQMPGRIVGATKDKNGKRAFVLTLQAREQHIKRERATSNICSNQSLCAIGASVYLSLLGPNGLQTVAARCLSRLNLLKKNLSSIKLLSQVHDGTFFHDISFYLPQNGAQKVAVLAEKGILCGITNSFCGKDVLTIGVTETHTPEMIHALTAALVEVFHA